MILYTIVVQTAMAIPPILTMIFFGLRLCGYNPCNFNKKDKDDTESNSEEENIPLRSRSILKVNSLPSLRYESSYDSRGSESSAQSGHSRIRQQNLRALDQL